MKKKVPFKDFCFHFAYLIFGKSVAVDCKVFVEESINDDDEAIILMNCYMYMNNVTPLAHLRGYCEAEAYNDEDLLLEALERSFVSDEHQEFVIHLLSEMLVDEKIAGKDNECFLIS